MDVLRLILAFLRVFFGSQAALAAENLGPRHQLTVLQRSVKRPKLRKSDRIFWSWLSRVWPGWKSALLIVQPDTVTRWHRQGVGLYWRWKYRMQQGRPLVDWEIRDLIHRMCWENPTWGAPRIQWELALPGHNVAESTVAKYMAREPKPPSQTWRMLDKGGVANWQTPFNASTADRPCAVSRIRPFPAALGMLTIPITRPSLH